MSRASKRVIASAMAFGMFWLGACVRFGPPEIERPAGERSDEIVIGAFNFTESRVLAEIYAQALDAAGFPTEVLGEVGSREIMEPALEQGQVDLVPEYVGTALAFVTATTSNGDPTAPAYPSLKEAFGERGITVLDKAPGENRNEFVVRRSLATRLGIETISDLAPLANELRFGGPPECPARPLCLLGLEDVYGIRFETFVPLDSGGSRTVAAIHGREVDVALLFTTNPALSDERLVTLRDDRGLQPPENIVPVVRSEIVSEYGERFVEVIDRITARLTDRSLRTLNHRVEVAGASVEAVAERWLQSQT